MQSRPFPFFFFHFALFETYTPTLEEFFRAVSSQVTTQREGHLVECLLVFGVWRGWLFLLLL